VDVAVPTGRKRNATAATRFTGAGQTAAIVGTVVADLAELLVHALVATVRSGSAQIGAPRLPVGVRSVVLSRVARFEGSLNLAVAAVRRLHAARCARIGRRRVHVDVEPDVALLRAVHLTVTAVRREGAVRVAGAVAAVVRAVVARLVGRHDAVAALGPANGPVGVEPREREAIARLRGVALGLENDDLVDLALFEIQIELPVDGLGLRAGLVDLRRRPRATVWLEGHRAFERRVHAAEVERELTLDEHPYVVVAAEVQHFAAAELEPVADLAREMEITRGRAAVDAEPVVVDREESVRRII